MKNIFNIILMICTFLCTVGCEDYLDNPPEDQISVNSFFRTANDLDNYVKKFYTTFPGHGNADVPKSEDNSDNLITPAPNSVINGERPTATGDWQDDWEDIRAINIFFDNLDNVEDGLELYAQSLGEAHFFRAMFYFDLLRKYGDVPIIDTQLFPDSEALLNPRDPRTAVVDFILSDLDNAIRHLGKIAVTGNARLNKEAALAFKSRVALYEGSWQKYHAGTAFGTSGANPNTYFQQAVNAAEELINGNYRRGIYSTGNPEDDYYALFGTEDMTNINEVLFYKVSSIAEGLGSNIQFLTTVRTADMAVTWSLISSYLDRNGDPYDYLGLAGTTKGNAFLSQIATDCDPRLASTIWIPGDVRVSKDNLFFDRPALTGGSEESCVTGFQVKKFSNAFILSAGSGFGGLSEIGRIHFRYAEVLLNYAEAKYELNGSVATAQLNLLRARVGMPDFDVIPQADYGSNLVDYGYAVSDELYAIRNERRVELALEGNRIDDYRRWAAHGLFKGKRPLGYPFKSSEFPGHNPSIDANGLIDQFASELPNGYTFREGQDYLNSIPQDELVLNPNLVQNPGW